MGGRELGYTFYRSNTWYKVGRMVRKGRHFMGAPRGIRLEGVVKREVRHFIGASRGIRLEGVVRGG